MTYSGSTTRIRRHSPTETPERSHDAHASAAAIKHRRGLAEHVGSIRATLGPNSTAADLHRSRVILDQIAELVRDGGSGISTGDCANLLAHLVSIYSGGSARREYSAFSATASAYARVIKALSRRCPTCDYRESIGQLLVLMTNLFETRDPSWKSIFRLLRALPKSVKGRERLRRVCSMHIPEWFDAGVPNLYAQQKELHREIERLDLEIETLQSAILTTGEELQTIKASASALADSEIAVLAEKRTEGQILLWQRKMRQSRDERNANRRAAAMVASNIRELGSRFRAAGRAYRLHLA